MKNEFKNVMKNLTESSIASKMKQNNKLDGSYIKNKSKEEIVNVLVERVKEGLQREATEGNIKYFSGFAGKRKGYYFTRFSLYVTIGNEFDFGYRRMHYEGTYYNVDQLIVNSTNEFDSIISEIISRLHRSGIYFGDGNGYKKSKAEIRMFLLQISEIFQEKGEIHNLDLCFVYKM